MSMKTTFESGKGARQEPCARAGVFLLAALLAATVDAGVAAAQAAPPFATAEIYEVREEINCNPGDSTAPDCSDANSDKMHGFGTRIADATLRGRATGGLAGDITIEASSILSQVDWTGPAHGKMLINTEAGTTVHAVFSGQLNLSLAMLGNPPTPLAPISGTWRGTKGSLKAGGKFQGVFLVPFQIPGAPEWGWFYLDLDENGQPKLDENGTPKLIPLQQHEYLGGWLPLVKLRVAFQNE
jgi:hypothetical protein